MNNVLRITALAALAMLGSLAASAQQPPAAPPAGAPYPAGWTGKELNAMPPMVLESEEFINQTCQPASLDNIQIMNMQKGHGQPINIHVYCKQDHAAGTHYKLTLVPVVDRRLGGALNPLLGRPNSRIVGFYFGKEGEDDAILLLEKTR